MRKASCRRLDTADDDRHVAVRLADAIAVHDDRAVGAFSRLAAGGICVLAPSFERNGIMRHHRVDVAAVDHKGKTGLAEAFEIGCIAPVGLRYHAYGESRVLQHPADDGSAERRVIDIGIAGHNDKVGTLNAARSRLGGSNRHEHS